jgi:drug/metabolite transporter (DMT)-like permease
MVYTGVAINGLAAVLMYDSMDHVDITVVAAFTAMTPVSGTVLSMVFLGETLHIHHIIGMVCVVVGVFIVATASTASTASTAPLAPKPQLSPAR